MRTVDPTHKLATHYGALWRLAMWCALLTVVLLPISCANKHRTGSVLSQTDTISRQGGGDSGSVSANRDAERSAPAQDTRTSSSKQPEVTGQAQTNAQKDAYEVSRARAGAGEKPTQRRVSTRPAPAMPELLFAFDSAQLSSASNRALTKYARWLKDNDVDIRIEGHTDERGTKEYNLALGRLRAQRALELISKHGVSSGRIKVVSYGEELPAVRGTGERVWRRNRRVELVVL